MAMGQLRTGVALPAAVLIPRSMCARCRRPTSVCYCSALPQIETATRVVILQHPRERDMPIGTARMASLCLPRAELHVGVRWAGERLAGVFSDPARPPILLYPGPGARDILCEPPRGPVTLVVVDGTWSQARTVVRDNPELQALPRYAFAAPEPSQYRIRREPRAEYVSTIEAVMHVLGALEGEPGRFRSLLDPLRAMVDAQLACQARADRKTVRHPRGPRPPRRTLPDGFAARWADLMCVVGEANAWPRRGGAEPAEPEELVHWAAYRVATGETFELIVAPERRLSPSTAFHIELTEGELRGGAARGALIERFARFSRSGDLYCAWGHHGLDLAIASGVPRAERLDLRAHARRITNRKLGSLEGYAAAFGPVPPPLAPGRAGRRLALLVQVLHAWRDRDAAIGP
ncbi:MAG: DTW domain-containing protein [Deltaproteobacteria bacterium]|nr:MAG: DTW domain-containing protein [Deltaproteobacteria bacterium]